MLLLLWEKKGRRQRRRVGGGPGIIDPGRPHWQSCSHCRCGCPRDQGIYEERQGWGPHWDHTIRRGVPRSRWRRSGRQCFSFCSSHIGAPFDDQQRHPPVAYPPLFDESSPMALLSEGARGRKVVWFSCQLVHLQWSTNTNGMTCVQKVTSEPRPSNR